MTVNIRTGKFIELLNNEIENNNNTYIYESGNIIKGFMTTGDCRDDDKNEQTFELGGIYVDPLFQRQHIGTELVKKCIEEAKSKNKTEITVWVFEKNKNSIEFYEKMGFKKDGKIKTIEAFDEKAIRLNKIL
jgi:ribosomal protein S18 acetylase RimI-like enzyme